MFRQTRDFLELIKLEHTLFVLPFAYLSMVLAADGWPTPAQVAWITLAMVAARTVAMGTNRLADRRIDAQNPRTAARPLASGRMAPRTALIGTAVAAALLIVAAHQLGPLPLRLLPIALVFLVGYAFTKRITWLSHFILGFTDGLAPVGAWVAVRGSLFAPADLAAWILLGAITCWIGGSDLIYACQDAEFDRRLGLHAIPARFGVRAALRLSQLSHGVALGLLVSLAIIQGLGWPYTVGLLLVAALLIIEHRLVSADDLSRLDLAFFQLNVVISFALFVSVLIAVHLPKLSTTPR